MKKTMILLVTVLLVLMVSITYAEQKQMSAQTKLSAEEQIEYLGDSIKTYDDIIKETDSIIDIYQKQRTSIVEQRAKLSVLKDMLVSSSRIQVKERGTGTEIVGYTAAGALGAVSPVGGVVLAVGTGINAALDHSIKKVEQHNQKIEEKLKEQRDWKASHPGRR
ncbi:MAG: hypothetical protein C0399_12950 [Syntrophus sp. (in: bacteria)]|nr:hypothetical protein [Syntrophus sp. (in: bacteria)]